MSGVPSMKTRREPIRSFGLCSTSGLFELLIGPHHAGQRIVVGNADHGKAELARLVHIIRGSDPPRRKEKFVVMPISA